MFYHLLFTLTVLAQVKLRDIVTNFNRHDKLKDLPFPSVLVRSIYGEILDTYDDGSKTFGMPKDGEFKVNPALLLSKRRIPAQKLTQLFCTELEILANGHREKSTFYQTVLNACAEKKPMQQLMEGTIDAFYSKMIWSEVLSINRRIVHNLEINKQELQTVKKMCADENYDALVRLMDPPLEFSKGEFLGKGASGSVHVGYSKETGRVAVKTISLGRTKLTPLINEIQATRAMLGNPYFVQLYSVQMSKFDEVLLAMELLDGRDGKWIAENKRITDMGVLAAIIKSVLPGLQSLHKHGCYLHNDIKYDNIHVTKEGKVKILDLGLSTPIGRPFERGQFKAGVAGLAGPELYNPQVDYSAASDVWTVGTLAIHLSTNRWMNSLPQRGTNLDDDPQLLTVFKNTFDKELEAFPGEAKKFLQLVFIRRPKGRPTIDALLEHQFIKEAASEERVKQWVFQ